MTRDQLRHIFIEELMSIAPDIDLDGVPDTADLRDAVDLDSMDIMNLLIALHQRLGVDIPEADAIKLTTLGGAVAYLAERSSAT
ncbi:MAG: acyl carrier protein [Parvibaculum sp.]|uniref:acyl carrier protein n=1 Tax=Parvibaculum sp. TaxID=2024848 RepID=UPI00272623B0|nr:acyl carrier protein [Parvibaculum sp.]MDO8840442.1 acyl carrier protein [Parvibaculum sp.]